MKMKMLSTGEIVKTKANGKVVTKHYPTDSDYALHLNYYRQIQQIEKAKKYSLL